MTPARRDLVNTILEITAVVLVVGFFSIVFPPAILPTMAAAIIAYTRSHR